MSTNSKAKIEIVFYENEKGQISIQCDLHTGTSPHLNKLTNEVASALPNSVQETISKFLDSQRTH